MSGAGGLRRNSQCQCPFLEILYAPSLSCSRVSFGSMYSNKFNKNFVNISLVLFLTARVKSMVSASILYQIVIDTRPQRSSGSPAHLVSTESPSAESLSRLPCYKIIRYQCCLLDLEVKGSTHIRRIGPNLQFIWVFRKKGLLTSV